MKSQWGIKHKCVNCNAQFYDMRKPEASCPKCETPVNDEAILLAKIRSTDETEKIIPVEVDPLDNIETLDNSLTGDETPDDLIEDTEDLVGTDETDMSEVFEHIDDGTQDKNA